MSCVQDGIAEESFVGEQERRWRSKGARPAGTREKGIRYAWVDTCCIDKSSSAELSESINSKFKWYQPSEICYAFLEDWSPEWDWPDLSPLAYDEIWIQWIQSRLISSKPTTSEGDKGSPLKWFTRGWTLQELIAPAKVHFYDSKWSMRGSKSDDLVAEYLSGITGIRLDILVNGSELALCRVPIGQRMSWAAHRETTRTEDLAYCLLGIFQVNMPMLYGEGERAFLRLQEEIIKSSTDLSIFAWLQDPDDPDGYQELLSRDKDRGLLSRHPREFSLLRDCEPVTSRYIQTQEITTSNKGFRLHTCLFYYRPSPSYIWADCMGGTIT
ncbi:hypothetical protein QBC37DRAFT_446007 [Rhypophila decipiens]|uniref:Heterokaryon incompatibility domain-containing protein n=1 Tax=Rhypophila decipiens TaxID=261697 RepID=A0AAN6Y3K2_9PEZI|nr:hypothetical protein QBC37DRAFT_446007 [Rhypophila decipiens]